MPALSPQAMRQRRDLLIQAAVTCFARNGYRATSMRDICAEAGVSIGGLYAHFASKAELIDGVAAFFRDTSVAGDAERPIAEPADVVAALEARLDEAYASHPQALAADVSLLGEAIHIEVLRELLRDRDRDQIETVARDFARCASPPGEDLAALASLVVAASYGLTILAAFHDDIDTRACFALLARLISRAEDAADA